MTALNVEQLKREEHYDDIAAVHTLRLSSDLLHATLAYLPQTVIACSQRRHAQHNTVLYCLVRVGGVNTIGDKTRRFCLVSSQFPICNCSVSSILRITENLEIGKWV